MLGNYKLPLWQCSAKDYSVINLTVHEVQLKIKNSKNLKRYCSKSVSFKKRELVEEIKMCHKPFSTIPVFAKISLNPLKFHSMIVNLKL